MTAPRSTMHPQPQNKNQVMTKSAPVARATEATKNSKQLAHHKNVLPDNEAGVSNIVLPGRERAAAAVKPAAKNALFTNDQARATNVLLAGLDPNTRAARTVKQAVKNTVFTNEQARATNVLLTGLDPTPHDTTPAGWQVTERTIYTTRVTSTGTYKQARVKDISVQPKSNNHRQLVAPVKTEGFTRHNKATKNAGKIVSNNAPVTPHRPLLPVNKIPHKKVFKPASKIISSGGPPAIPHQARPDPKKVDKKKDTKVISSHGTQATIRRSVLPAERPQGKKNYVRNVGTIVSRAGDKFHYNKKEARNISKRNASNDLRALFVASTPSGKLIIKKKGSRNISKRIASSDLRALFKASTPSRKPIINKRARNVNKRIASDDLRAIFKASTPTKIDKQAKQSSLKSDAGTIIGPVPGQFRKRAKGKFRRNTVFGLFSGEGRDSNE